MIQDLINTSKIVEGAEIFMAEKKIIGTCPCCGAEVVERQKGMVLHQPILPIYPLEG